MDMAEHALLFMVFFLYEVLVPFLQFVHHLRTDMLLHVLGHIVTAFVNLDDIVEKLVYPDRRTAHRRHHRHADQLAQFFMVELVSAGFKLVVHVQGDDHLHIHVDELGGQIEVPFQIGCVHHIDDDVRGFLDDVLAYIDFLRRISGKRIGTRQVDNAEMVSLEVEEAFLGVHGHTAIVAHMLVCPTGYIK